MNFLVSTRSNAMHTMIVYMNYFFSNRLSCRQYHNRIVFNKFMHIFFFHETFIWFSNAYASPARERVHTNT